MKKTTITVPSLRNLQRQSHRVATMNPEYRRELNSLKKAYAKIYRDYEREADRLAKRADKAAEKIDRRMGILEGRLS